MNEFRYDVAVSYASEERPYVERVVRYLQMDGLKVFFAPDVQESLIGENMLEVFYPVYKRESMFVAAFVSEAYLKKDYTRQEADIALFRSKEEKRNCLIPIYFGKARLEALNRDINYLSADKQTENAVAYYIKEKVKKQKNSSGFGPADMERCGREDREVGAEHPAVNIIYAGQIINSNIQCDQRNEGEQRAWKK